MTRVSMFLLSLLLISYVSISFAATPPPTQAPSEAFLLAELRPERGSSARLLREMREVPSLGAVFAGSQQVQTATLWTPERRQVRVDALSPDRPESILRRLVIVRYPAQTELESQRQRLLASGLFSRVTIERTALARPHSIPNSEPLGPVNNIGVDPHRWQWSLETVRAPGGTGAWGLTRGRALIANQDFGIQRTHVDVVSGSFSNLRAHLSVNAWRDGGSSRSWPDKIDEIFPGEPYAVLSHGHHVSSLMAAPINSVGVAGVCPNCPLQALRVDDPTRVAAGLEYSGRFGASALNMSFELPGYSKVFDSALDALAAQDVVMVASTGNDTRAFTTLAEMRLPQSNPAVIRVGATDIDNLLWRETTIASRTPSRRHPAAQLADVVPFQTAVLNRCDPQQPWFTRFQCGSNVGATAQAGVVTLVAPGAQVVGALARRSGHATDGIYSQVPIHPDNSQVAPSRTNLGVGSAGVQDLSASSANHGPMTGTSMAAPHVTATAGLMRSINPLVSAPSVRTALTQSARNGPDVIPAGQYNPAEMGAGLLDSRGAVERAAGTVRGQLLGNRLTPVFAMYARRTVETSEIFSEDLPDMPAARDLHSWLYTTNAQLAAAAMRGEIYRSLDPHYRATEPSAYRPSHLLLDSGRSIGIPMPQSVYQLPSAAHPFREPAASFYVYTTPRNPSTGLDDLQPLMRFSTRWPQPDGVAACPGQQPKHTYTTQQTEANSFVAQTPTCDPAQPMSWWYEGIEGYVYPRTSLRPNGALALFRSRHAALQVDALIVETENLTTAFAGYDPVGLPDTANPKFLGWVYPSFRRPDPDNDPTQPSTLPADKDSDGLPDGVEVALRLNEESANGDCEGPNDAVEYGFASLPSDPMSLTPNCVDGRVRVLRPNPNATGEARVIFSNPAGPMAFPAGTAIRVTFFQGGGWPTVVPPGCVYDDSDVGSSFEHYLCSISSPLAASPGSVVEFVFQVEARTNPSPPAHQAVVRVPAGFTDPGLVINNSATF